MNLWNEDIEISFFEQAIKNFASVEQLFYKLSSNYYAYIPKGMSAENRAMQNRNSLIGSFTEKWCRNLIEPIAKKHGLYVVNSAVCEQIGLTRQSPADLVISKRNTIKQEVGDIKVIFEIKMSIVSNYEYCIDNKIRCVGNYKSHKGVPSLLRSDSVLKAIGKSVDIRVCPQSATIPIVVLGNSPIGLSYIEKVDQLKQSGVVQSFISLNPKPIEGDFIKASNCRGFITPSSYMELENICENILNTDFYYFSAMKNKQELGNIINLASREKSDVERAERFLQLINL